MVKMRRRQKRCSIHKNNKGCATNGGKKVIIIGAGVAGLTAALELLRQSDEYIPIVLEEEKEVGGIARTLEYRCEVRAYSNF